MKCRCWGLEPRASQLAGGQRVGLWSVLVGVLELEDSTRLGSECSRFGFLIVVGLGVPGLLLEVWWMECSMGIGTRNETECSGLEEGSGR